MVDLFTLNNLFALAMLILLQAVLGVDNLLYISIESKRVSPDRQAFVRKLGIGMAIVLRIVMLYAVVQAIDYFQNPFFVLSFEGLIEANFNIHAFIVMLGGIFIIYTAMKEIYHMLVVDHIELHKGGGSQSVTAAVCWIVVMNLIFSFDSILSAMALSDVFMVMATAIVISGILMIWLADRVAEFLDRNRMYEVLGLFILFIVGVMLVSEGGHLAHLTFFGHETIPMAKSTFYFVIGILVLIDIVQARYQRKLLAQRQARTAI